MLTHVAAAELMMTIRTQQICLSQKDSDNVILQQETETIHVSKFQLFFTRNLLDLHFLLNLRQVAPNTLLILLQMLLIFPLKLLKFRRCFTEQTASLVFQCVACDTFHLIHLHNLMRSPSLVHLMFESTLSFPHIRSGHFGGLYNCNMNFTKRCLLVFLSCSFEACLSEVQSVSALLLPVNMLHAHMFRQL